MLGHVYGISHLYGIRHPYFIVFINISIYPVVFGGLVWHLYGIRHATVETRLATAPGWDSGLRVAVAGLGAVTGLGFGINRGLGEFDLFKDVAYVIRRAGLGGSAR